MKTNLKNFILIFSVILIIVLFSACGETNETSNDPGNDGNHNKNVNKSDENINREVTNEQGEAVEVKVEIGYAAPDFSVELLSGETVRLSDCRNKVVFINFWATWCGPCVREMPDIQQLAEYFPDELVVLAVNCNEKKGTVDKFIKDNGYTFNIGLDESGEIQKKYPTNGIPYTIIINADGIITKTHLGASGDMFSVYKEDVLDALGR